MTDIPSADLSLSTSAPVAEINAKRPPTGNLAFSTVAPTVATNVIQTTQLGLEVWVEVDPDLTANRTTQIGLEVWAETYKSVRVTQQFVEVIRGDTAIVSAKLRVTQQFVEVIRGDVAVAGFKEVPSANLVLSTSAPTVEMPQDYVIVVPSADLTLSTSAPLLSAGPVIVPQSGNLELSTAFSEPEIVVDTPIAIPSTNLTLSTSPPDASLNDNLKVIPSANLVLTTSQVVVVHSEIVVPSANLTLSTSTPEPALSERIVGSGNLTLSTSAPMVRVLIPYTTTPGAVLKMMIITQPSEIVLPGDWNPVNNRIWVWGAGGRGAHASEVGALLGGAGGGGGGFDEVLNVGGAAGDVWTASVGIGSGGKHVSNATWVKDESLAYLAYADSGNNGGGAPFAGGGTGGSGGSIANSNSGGFGQQGGGGGGAAAGPHSALGTKGATGAKSNGGFAGVGVAGGGGGGGGGGDYAHIGSESGAQNGETPPLGGRGGSGGHGYYGEGGGEGSPFVANDGVENTGGGGSGGRAFMIAPFTGSIVTGGAGANWSFIQGLPTNAWMIAPFNWSTTLSGRFAELSNGTVPGGGGGGGGSAFGIFLAGAFGSDGGVGGFPGGGGGGSGWDSNGLFGGTVGGDDALGGEGAGGLILIFYEGLPGVPCLPCDEDFSACGDVEESDCEIEWPFAELQPRGVGVHMVPATLGGGKALADGLELPTGTDNGFWRFSYRGIRVNSNDQIRRWYEIEALLDGKAGVVCVHAYDGKRAPWLTVGDPIEIRASGVFAAGSRTGAVNVISGGEPKAGMFFSYNNRLYMLTSVGTPTASVYPVTVWPTVRAQIPGNAFLVFDHPTCRARLADEDGMTVPLYLLQHSKQDVDFEEDI